jgi:uncharacterized membrane protein YfcA
LSPLLTEPRLAVLSACVVLAYAVQTITGFGSQVIALSLGALLFPLEEVMPVVLALNLCVCAVTLARNWLLVERGLLGRSVLPWMGAGAVGGLGVVFATGAPPRWPFGAIVLAQSLRELLRIARGRTATVPGPAATRAYLVAGGIAHGLYGSGGPLAVTAIARTGLDVHRLRATLVALWLILNSFVLAALVARGAWTHAVTVRALALSPTVPLGILLGEALRARANESSLRLAVQVLLFGSGAALVS